MKKIYYFQAIISRRNYKNGKVHFERSPIRDYATFLKEVNLTDKVLEYRWRLLGSVGFLILIGFIGSSLFHQI